MGITTQSNTLLCSLLKLPPPRISQSRLSGLDQYGLPYCSGWSVLSSQKTLNKAQLVGIHALSGFCCSFKAVFNILGSALIPMCQDGRKQDDLHEN